MVLFRLRDCKIHAVMDLHHPLTTEWVTQHAAAAVATSCALLKLRLGLEPQQLNARQWCVGLVLKVFLALLPWLLSILGRVQGLHSQSTIDFSVISKFYIFQVCSLSESDLSVGRTIAQESSCVENPSCCTALTWDGVRNDCPRLHVFMPGTLPDGVMWGCTVTQFITVFLGSFIAGSVLNQARALLNNPTSIFPTLGTAAPLTSIFFLTWIELNVRWDASPLTLTLYLCCHSLENSSRGYNPMHPINFCCASMMHMHYSAMLRPWPFCMPIFQGRDVGFGWTLPESWLSKKVCTSSKMHCKLLTTVHDMCRLWQQSPSAFCALLALFCTGSYPGLLPQSGPRLGSGSARFKNMGPL